MAGFRVLFIALAFLLLLADKGHAQTSVYVTVMEGNFGFAGDSYPNGPSWKPRTTGFTSGALFMYPAPSRFRPGFDIRGAFSSGYNGGRAYTVALRLSFVPDHLPFRPYGQFGGGYASTQLRKPVCIGSVCGIGSRQISGGVLLLSAGLDIRVAPQLDIRAFDYARYTGGSGGLTHPAVRSFSAGVVYHAYRRGLSSP